jgi:hypothetical protein
MPGSDMPIPAGVKFKLRRGFKGDHKLLENNVFQYFGPTRQICGALHIRGYVDPLNM